MDSRRWVVPLGVATSVLLLAGLVTVVVRQGDDGFASEVMRRPWPARVTPTGQWSASIRGTGEHLTVVKAEGQDFRADHLDDCLSCGAADPQPRGRIPGGFGRATFTLDDEVDLVFPDGSRWRPSGGFRLDSDADLPIAAVQADGARLRIAPGARMGGLVQAAGAPLSAQGTFVGPAGQKVDRLTLPAGTRALQGPSDNDEAPFAKLTAVAGTAVAVDTRRDTEVAVAGTAHAEALDQAWDGLVAAVQGHGMVATATWGPGGWTVSAESKNAFQLWVDVWPVADTVLTGTVRYNTTGRGCGTPCPTELRWKNVGWATSQFYEAVGEGPGADDVHFRLNRSLGHDAALGVRRRVRASNLDRGDPVDSNLVPGDDAEAGVNHGAQPATVVVRGNFPDLRFEIDLSSPAP